MIKRVISLFLILGLIFSIDMFSMSSSAKDATLVSYSFEDDEEDWEYWSNTGSKNTYVVSEASADGEHAMFLSDTSKSDTAGIKSNYFSVTEGYTYTLLASAFVIKTKVYMYLRFYDENNKQLSDDNVVFTGKSWEEKAIVKTAPDGAVKGRIILCTVAIDIAGAYIDNIRIKEGNETPAGIISGKVPAKLPDITEMSEECETFDDGYEEGEIIYFQSFEKGIDDWATYVNSSSYKVVEKNSSNGINSLYIKDTSQNLSAGAKSKTISVAQGNKYTVYMDAYVLVSGISLYARYYDSSGKQISQQYVNMPSNGWNVVRLALYAPENTVSCGLILAGSVAGLGESYFDNIRIYKGNIIARPDEIDFSEPVQQNSVNSQIIAPVNNKLIYNTYNEYGDKLSDFSYAGYYGGAVNLPETEKLPVAITLSPTGAEDDTKHIQNAIDSVYKEHSGKNMNVIKLKAGKYYINKNGIKLKSGILLSGEGQGPNGTVLHAKDAINYNVIQIAGTAPSKISDNIIITDDYIKSGSNKIHVADSSALKAGDLVRIVHPSTNEWIKALKMNDIVTVYGDLLSWHENAVNTITERVITSVNGSEITFDCGVFIPYEKQYAESYLYKIDDSLRIHDVGVENLRVTSNFNGDPYDTNHAKLAIYSTKSKNIFVRDVTAKNMFNGVFGCRDYAKQVTVLNCSSIDPVSTIVGGNRYPFYADIYTEQILFSGCYSYDGRHDYMAVKGTAGPVVFSDSIADMSNACSETHAEFATGVLFDNIYQISDRSKGFIGFPNRGYYGTETPQGWTAAGCVAWNCLSNAIIVNKPPLSYQNFTVGVWGMYDTDTSAEQKQMHIDSYKYAAYKYNGVEHGPESAFETSNGTSVIGDAYKESQYAPVNPRSIYKAQLAERFTGNILNVKPNSPVIVYPRPDKTIPVDENVVNINGIYEKGAETVYVYVDDVKYTAITDSEKNSFSVDVELSEGIHKIYATQVAGGTEGNKSADRFLIVGEQGNSNPSYLESVYHHTETSAILCDPRPSYDEYIASEAGNVTKIENADIVSASVTKYDSSFKTGTTDILEVLTDGVLETNISKIDYLNKNKVANNGLDPKENEDQNWIIELDKVYDLTALTLVYNFTNKWVNFNISVSKDKKEWSSPVTVSPLISSAKESPVTIPLDYLKGKYIKITVKERNGTSATAKPTDAWGPNYPSGCSLALYEILCVMGVADYSHNNFISGVNAVYTGKEPFVANNTIYKGASFIVFAKTVSEYGDYSLKEQGCIFSENPLTYDEFITGLSLSAVKSDKAPKSEYYGIRFFGNKIVSGRSYYILPYAIYSDTFGNELKVFGEKIITAVPE